MLVLLHSEELQIVQNVEDISLHSNKLILEV